MTTTNTTTKKKVTKAIAAVEAPIYSQKGTKTGSIALPGAVFGLSWNADLVHQVVTSMMSNARAGTAHTKDRGEVSGGGKKPWKQKGTGRARHGSSRSPIWVGGGATHGPRSEKDYSKKINKKMRAKALFTVLSRVAREDRLLLVDTLTLAAIKTQDALKVITDLATVSGFKHLTSKKHTTALVALPERNEVIEKSFANLPGVSVILAKDLNAVDALHARHIIVVSPETTIASLESKMK